MSAPKEHPLVELVGSCLADPTEGNVLIAKFLETHEVMPKAELNSMLVAVANRNAAYESENRVLREMTNLPDLDAIDHLNDMHYATEDDL
ncbi:hypothetical protein SEA_SEPHIROTH_48 [Gordonia Phage Sephiroth]|uniref:Uncharacterized protein n=1 Tax=Gordonia Phage Sephiroth TaxID=2767553 RepID=A0A7G9UZD6_9CAUD|nr:hypothetical protein L3Y23_gp048 [Gordonia Phage Sephiroth]QNN99391.1 hypothetical protein SEA_SEPHIROTH_48 [Gordonia Phage Sephiroth]